MEFTCTACSGGTASDGNPCAVCGGDGVISLVDSEFGKYTLPPKVHGMAWNEILTKLDANAEALDYIHGKVRAIWNQVKP